MRYTRTYARPDCGHHISYLTYLSELSPTRFTETVYADSVAMPHAMPYVYSAEGPRQRSVGSRSWSKRPKRQKPRAVPQGQGRRRNRKAKQGQARKGKKRRAPGGPRGDDPTPQGRWIGARGSQGPSGRPATRGTIPDPRSWDHSTGKGLSLSVKGKQTIKQTHPATMQYATQLQTVAGTPPATQH